MERRNIPLALLQAFRTVDDPRESKAVRMVLDDEEKVVLSKRIWVQEDGEVYSDMSGSMVRLAQYKCGEYSYVGIYLKGKQRSFKVNRLVLFAWHYEQLMKRCRAAADAHDAEHLHPDDYEANHKNNDTNDNSAINIEPVTGRENKEQSYARSERLSSAPARSRPVVVAEVNETASDQARAFKIGDEFLSISDAARQTDINVGNIKRSVEKGTFAAGVRFEAGVLQGDQDPPDRVWYPSTESEKWCLAFGGSGIRTSNDGLIWSKKGSLKSRGSLEPGSMYHRIGVGRQRFQAHILILRCGHGGFDKRGEWVPETVPTDAAGRDLLCLHGGPGRAPDAVRREDGYERNYLADLRWGTRMDNAADLQYERERANKRPRIA
jgi:hypothetical protein